MSKSDKIDIPSDKELVEKMDIPFTPIDNKVLIKPLEPIYIEKEVEKPTKPKDYKNKSLKQAEKGPASKTKKETETVEANVRRGVVLATPEQPLNDKAKFPISSGDIVVYWDKSTIPTFELFRDSVLVNQYEILGKWDTSKERDNDIYGRVYKESDNEE